MSITEEDRRKITQMGVSAQGLMENPALRQAILDQYDQAILDWLQTDPLEVEKREHTWRTKRSLLHVVSTLETMLQEAEALAS